MAYHHGDLREALLVAAETLLQEGGPAAVTLRACARRAGVSHAAPQHHFKDLADLLAEVAARGFDRLTETLRAGPLVAGQNPEARFIAVSRVYVGFARSDPALFRLMFRTDALNAENSALSTAARQAYATMSDSVALQRGSAVVSADDLKLRLQDSAFMEDILLAWSHMHGFALLLLEGQLDIFIGDDTPDEFIERMLGRNGRRLSRLLQRAED